VPRSLYLDLHSGISGDMFLAALLDLGLDAPTLASALRAVPVGEHWELEVTRARRGGIEGTRVRFLVHGHPADEPHAHGHHGHSHGRHYSDIDALIAGSPLPDPAKNTARAVFRRLGEAEARVHGTPLDEVHFHEVGALDSILDICGGALALHLLDIGTVLASYPVEGTGHIHCAHGTMPLPVPATAELLKGVPLRQTGLPHELITPTGAAFLAVLVRRFGPLDGFAAERIGYGCGGRDLPGHANLLRAFLGEASAEALGESDEVTVLTTNLDHISPEIAAHALERLMAAGALDAALLPAQMKKGRPAWQLQIITRPGDAGSLARLLFSETGTLGVRHRTESRWILPRESIAVETPHGPVPVKIARLDGRIVSLHPEFVACRDLALKAGVPLDTLVRDAVRAAATLENHTA
jgi:pyridinium-3,5-bisthiocarboxylic acid mononucleotide nickel chelatase